MNYRNYLIKIIKSFTFAFQGIGYCIKNEINMRFHIVATVFVMIFSQFYNMEKGEIIVLLLTISSVMAFEIINTSIETLVNLVSPKYHNLAKITKDTAAGAVLFSAIFSIFVAFILFWDLEVFAKIHTYLKTHTLSLIGLIILVVFSYIFVFKCFKKTKENNLTTKEEK